MKGAREFYYIIQDAVNRNIGNLERTELCTSGGDSKSYRYKNFIFTTASHTRGKEFYITLIDDDDDELLEVYGRTGGQYGWNETYGWLHKGTWVKPILLYLKNLKEEIAQYDKQLEEQKREKQRQENKKIEKK